MVGRRKANAAPANNSQNRETGRKKASSTLIVDSRMLTEKDVKKSTIISFPAAVFSRKASHSKAGQRI